LLYPLIDPVRDQSSTHAYYVDLLRLEIAMPYDKKVDGPDTVEFVKAATQGMMSAKDSKKLWYGLAGAYTAGRVLRRVINR
jgi:hypothetical protein